MKVFIVLEKKKWEEMKEEINKIPNDKISDETVQFLKDNPEGSVKDLPKDWSQRHLMKNYLMKY